MIENFIELAGKLLPEKVDLIYVHPDDNLNRHTTELQQCIRTGLTEAVDCLIDDFYWEQREENIGELLRELRVSLQSEGYAEEDIEASITEHREDLLDILYARDNSDPVEDLFRNTGDDIMFYDTGLYCDADWDASDARKRLVRMKIKNVLGLKGNRWDKDIMEMIENGFCGNLEIYFTGSVRDFIVDRTEGIRSLKFGKNLNIGIVNHMGGSGDTVNLEGAEAVMPFDRERIFIEGAVSYSWSYDIAGMCSDWCDDTTVGFLAAPVQVQLEDCSLNEHIDREAEYERKFRSGGCTFGDMKITRHRGTQYINDFPCGTKCPHCGTFWVD